MNAKQYNKSYYKMTKKERHNIASKKYYEKNKEKILERAKDYYKKHKEDIKKQQKKYCENPKIKKQIKEYMKEYNQIHKEELKKYQSEYRKSHKTESRIYHKVYIKTKRNDNIDFKVLDAIRTRIYLALKGNPKTSTTMKLVGCSIKKLKRHLESKFKPGMNWKNHGRKGWVIDHIRPCCSFDLSNPKEQKKCFYYTNLQPLWEKDNMKKGKKNV